MKPVMEVDGSPFPGPPLKIWGKTTRRDRCQVSKRRCAVERSNRRASRFTSHSRDGHVCVN